VSDLRDSSAATAGLAGLDAIAATAWTLEPPMPHERKHLLRDEAAFLLDGLLVRVARGRGALDVAIGEGLDALGTGDRALRLGWSCLGDYSRERLGILGSTAEKMARLSRAVRDRPLLRDAVRRGEVTARKAETVLAIACGDAEEAWVARARTGTVRSLRAAVQAALAADPEPDEAWERITIPIEPAARARLDEAMALAGKLLGSTAPKWQRLEAICSEYLGAHAAPDDVDGDVFVRGPIYGWLEAAKEGLEHEMDAWSFLEEVAPVAAPDSGTEQSSHPAALDEDLRRLAGMRDRWDEVLGHVAMLLRLTGLWRDMGFASFGHYCEERLGMAERTVAQRASLAARFYALPALRQALRDHRLSYEKARLVASCADDGSIDAWIARAERLTCVALRREIEAGEEKQMCARGEVDLRVPERVGGLLASAIRAAEAVAGRWLSPGECLERIAAHFIETWKDALAERNTVRKRVLTRDGGFCQVPGCSRAAAHAHHVVFRSVGGGDEAENLVSLCAAHHLHGVHMGWVQVHGRAPDALLWRLGTSWGVSAAAEA
jgi:hypothetical protein